MISVDNSIKRKGNNYPHYNYHHLILLLSVIVAVALFSVMIPNAIAIQRASTGMSSFPVDKLLGSFNEKVLEDLVVNPTIKTVLSTTSASGNLSNSINEYASHFTLRNITKFDKIDESGTPRWNVTAWIQASPPQLLTQIKSVIYHPIKVCKSGCKPTKSNLKPITTTANKFALKNMSVIGNFPLTATLNFRNGNHTEIGPLNIKLPQSKGKSPVQFNLNPVVIGSSVSISGVAKANVGQIQDVSVDWGDGTKPDHGKFPVFHYFHTYSKRGQYTITVTAGNSNYGLAYSEKLQTGLLSLQNIIPSDSSYKIWKGQFVLTVFTSQPAIQENSATNYEVWGRLLNLSGIGIPNEAVNIRVFSLDHSTVDNNTESVNTTSNGQYSHMFSLNFQQGQAKALVYFPTNSKYSGLNVTKALFVIPQPISLDQLFTWLVAGIGTAIAVVGAIVKVPDYLTSRKQANYLGMYLIQINKKYDEFSKEENRIYHKEQYLSDLQGIRDTIISLLQKRGITENQFSMLDGKISDYQHKISNA